MLDGLDASILQKTRRPTLDLSEQLLMAPKNYYIILELSVHHNYVRRWISVIGIQAAFLMRCFAFWSLGPPPISPD